jgi:hypothetical protein
MQSSRLDQTSEAILTAARRHRNVVNVGRGVTNNFLCHAHLWGCCDASCTEPNYAIFHTTQPILPKLGLTTSDMVNSAARNVEAARFRRWRNLFFTSGILI